MPSRRTIAYIALCLGIACGCKKPAVEPPKPKPPEVVVATPIVREVGDYEDFTGHTEAVASITIRSRVSGYLEKIHFKDGADVKQGAPLFLIDPRTYAAAVDQAKAAVAQAVAHEVRTGYDHRRIASLLEKHAASREELDKALGDWGEAKAAVASARATQRLAEINLEYTNINSPITGRLSRRMIDAGNLVKADDTPLVSIVSLDPIYVDFDVDERTVLRIRRLIQEGKATSARDATVRVQVGLGDEEGFSQTGPIDFIDNRIESGTGTLRLRATLENPKHLLSPGLFVRVRVPVGAPHPALLVPEESLGSDQGQRFVYVVDAQNKVGYRRVKPGVQFDRYRAIEDGLSSGDRVVVSGLQRVREGIEVAAKTESKSKDAPAVKGKDAGKASKAEGPLASDGKAPTTR